MKYALSGIILVAFLSGCASVQKPVGFSESYWQDTSATVGIAASVLPEANTWETGGMGLVDLAIVDAAMKKLTTHLKSQDLSEFLQIRGEANRIFSAAGFQTVVLDNEINLDDYKKAKSKAGFVKKNFNPLKEDHGLDQLFLLTVTQAGTTRGYYGFLPTSEPQAIFKVSAQIINLADGKILWFHREEQIREITGEWDEPDANFPNITNALYQSLDAAKENIISELQRH